MMEQVWWSKLQITMVIVMLENIIKKAVHNFC